MTPGLLEITIARPIGFLLFAMGSPLVVRVILAFLSSLYSSKKIPAQTFSSEFLGFVFGAGGRDPDYWSGYFVGVVELVIFPFLLAAGGWTVIGAWIAGQTAIGWKHWHGPELRIRFNHFLIATGLVLMLSYVSACCTLSIPAPTPTNSPPTAASTVPSGPAVLATKPRP